jgi:hypothetical protein
MEHISAIPCLQSGLHVIMLLYQCRSERSVYQTFLSCQTISSSFTDSVAPIYLLYYQNAVATDL